MKYLLTPVLHESLVDNEEQEHKHERTPGGFVDFETNDTSAWHYFRGCGHNVFDVEVSLRVKGVSASTEFIRMTLAFLKPGLPQKDSQTWYTNMQRLTPPHAPKLYNKIRVT